ncbi:hypothetical protein G6321_00046180 [Bradyrhizobium barranii subsp. barranii]|uniref:Transmembrane protein n=1 Tax=Bradyrhizobium barranii subsp. barranii TaxID=2823807 RepID=A0A7Z0QDZ5_9BRAD|nr:hypothetical protein [Bradyrhizobium barranii]UGX92940.1 hypothetical protein G6321_00046180 [Bradyrhizobium barranii subsp. barranii]
MRSSEGTALVALAIVALWVFVGLPILYLPSHEHEGIKPGEWLVGLATVALVLATAALWWATRDLVKGSEAASKRQLRAYVVLNSLPFEINAPNNHLLFVTGRLELQSVGQTPATVTDGFINKRIVPRGSEMPDGYTAESPNPVHVTLGTGSPAQKFGAMSVTREQIIDCVEGRTQIYLFAHVRYYDVYGDTHEIIRALEFVSNIHPEAFERLGNNWAMVRDQPNAFGCWTIPNYGRST